MIGARADTVGSLLRPPWLKEARECHAAGTIGAGEIERIEDAAVDEVVKLQEEAGLGVVTDGETRPGILCCSKRRPGASTRKRGGVSTASSPRAPMRRSRAKSSASSTPTACSSSTTMSARAASSPYATSQKTRPSSSTSLLPRLLGARHPKSSYPASGRLRSNMPCKDSHQPPVRLLDLHCG